ncbi:MAG TPA: Pycsar system effector family protein [Flavisolibacter sp.]|jgi:predicted metal-dependent HD superfamily phosphohydrolase|nr:Pycsar system effector family protein [Flavisolibacter sp.]
MNETNSHLLGAARAYVTDVFQHKVNPEFVFHSLEHTEDVVEACSHMANHYQLHDEDRLVLMLAAWFHDTGYSAGRAEGHEDVSVHIATQFLTGHQVDDTTIQRVASCIQATKMPQSPVSLIEKILCDADLFHLSTEDFKARNQLLKQERESMLGHKIDKKEWRKSNIQFLTSHRYFTDYGQEFLEPKKQNNLALFTKKKTDKKETATAEPEKVFPYLTEVEAISAQDQKNAERGIQTMFRTTSNNHIELSGMADSKAHILITVNSIILSVAVSYGLPRIIAAGNEEYIIPTVMLVLTCLVCVTFAILATRPSINSGRFTEEDIRNKKTNLLFFGNFHRMQLEDYQWGMNQMIRDKEYLYNTMMMDIYYLGVVLARKYRYLRIAYTVFMVGLIIVVIALGTAAFVDNLGGGGGNSSQTKIDY